MNPDKNNDETRWLEEVHVCLLNPAGVVGQRWGTPITPRARRESVKSQVVGCHEVVWLSLDPNV